MAWDREWLRAVVNVVNKLRFTNAPYSSLPELQNGEMKIFTIKKWV
jgi:hypothetical protein